eukprot:5007208-Prymnesium_polylepis.1
MADLSFHLGMARSPLMPMAAVGARASETKRTSGCQNQKCEKTAMPCDINGAVVCVCARRPCPATSTGRWCVCARVRACG